MNAVRIIAALQVAVHHSLAHFRLGIDGRFVYILSLFPGVPIFFFASGMLISRSLHRSGDLRNYARNRALRLYPGLWAAFVVGITLAVLGGYRPETSLAQFVAWTFGQLSVVQFYNPHFMRAYGTGVLNGSLWTIVVELQFYALLPVLLITLRAIKRGSTLRNTVLGVLAALFALANVVFMHAGGQTSDAAVLKFVDVSFVPWVYMFIVGVIVEENFDVVFAFVQRFVLPLTLAAALLLCASRPVLGFDVDNRLNPAVFAMLATLIFVASFALRPVFSDAQKRWDISYGLYLYHMPVVNLLLYRKWPSRLSSVAVVLSCTVVLASLSWRFVESKALQRKARHRRARDPLTANVRPQ